MVTPTLSPLTFAPHEIAEIVDLYASNPGYCLDSGEYDPELVQADQVEADLREEIGTESCEVLLARDAQGALLGLLSLLHRHPRDGRPWIGLLLVHGRLHRRGVGRRLVDLVEERLRAEGRDGIRLAVLENRPSSLAFWSSLGWQEIDRRPDVQRGRPCIVMHKELA
ncbi:GNAT family N-acetyltransferase [Kitasatospora sp. NPDC052868]|uniref:GNAT family N-acetyltransferase n=1 Tax=Kitasatospora sp. NPDC052868 TaxID=3364060 RepID=UPI0037CB1E0A